MYGASKTPTLLHFVDIFINPHSQNWYIPVEEGDSFLKLLRRVSSPEIQVGLKCSLETRKRVSPHWPDVLLYCSLMD